LQTSEIAGPAAVAYVLLLLSVTAQVRVGSMCDPPELPGLAHFCEHMLFYSSEKYPVEDEYSK
jgi:predicted Zn-dependent peptidase